MEEILKEEMSRLEKIAKFSKEKARNLILKRCEEEMNSEIAELIKEKEREAKLTANEVSTPHFQLYFSQAVTIMVTFMILGTAAGLIPALKTMKIKPIEAMNDK